MAATYLAVIGDRVALAWVLQNQMMAFPTTRRSEIDRIEEGDELLLTATRGCFRNPTRDRTRVIGRATTRSKVTMAREPIGLMGRVFDRTCDLKIVSLAPVLSGVDLGPLVGQLSAFPDKKSWSVYLRRPVLRVSAADASVLRPLVDLVAVEPRAALPGYIAIGVERLRT